MLKKLNAFIDIAHINCNDFVMNHAFLINVKFQTARWTPKLCYI